MKKFLYTTIISLLCLNGVQAQTPNQPPQPTGAIEVCQDGPNEIYSTIATLKCDVYDWDLSPVAAGTITGTTINATVNWDPNFSGTAEIKVRGWNNTGMKYGVYSDPLAVLVKPKTQIVTDPVAQSICEGDNTSFTVVASGVNLTYQWYLNNNPIAGANDPTLNITNALLSQAGNYKAVVTGDCSSATSAEAVLLVGQTTTMATHPSNATVCEGETVNLTASANGAGIISYQWKKGGVNIAGATSPILTFNNILTTDAGNYTVEASATCGSATSNVGIIIVNALPVVALAPLPDVCENDPNFIYTQGVPTGGTYSGVGVIPPNVYSPQSATDGSYNITYSYTDGNGCTNTASQTQVVKPSPLKPTISASGSTNLCFGETVTLTSSAEDSYLWSTGAVTQAITVNSSNSYTVVVTNAQGCSSETSSTTTVTVNPNPNAYNLGSSNTYYCAGSSGVSITLDNSDVGTNYILYRGGIGISLLAGTGGPIVWNNMTAGTYTAVAENASTGCTTNMTGSITITERALPVLSHNGDQSICYGGSVQLSASGANSYTWSPSTALSNSTIANPIASPTNTITYAIIGVDGFGCQNSINQKVTVNSNPTANAGIDQDICNGSSTTITANGGLSYLWNTGDNTASITVAPSSNTTYQVTVTDVNTCQGTDDITVTVNPKPTANAGTDQNMCQGTSATLSASGGVSYIWSTFEATSSISVSPTDDTEYEVTVTNAFGCTDNDKVMVFVIDNPIVDAGANQDACEGETVTLTANAAGGTGPYEYEWNNGEVLSSINVNPAATTSYTVTATDQNGCISTDNTTVTIHTLPTPAISGLSTSYCLDADAINLTGLPTDIGGTFSFPSSPASLTDNGDGTAILNPFQSGTAIGAGSYILNYDYSDGNGCDATATENVVIGNLTTPNVNISGIDELYAEADANTYTITGTPAPAGAPTIGTFSCPDCGGGLTDNGNGTASFSPAGLPSLGKYGVSYTYFNGSCENTISDTIIVGLPVNIINLATGYCETDGAFLFENDNTVAGTTGIYYVYSGTSSATGTLLYTLPDNGTASFDPSSSPVGDYTVKYEINKAGGFSNETEETFSVVANPSAAFILTDGTTIFSNSDANIEFCASETVSLSGTPNTGGVFSGIGVSGTNLTREAMGEISTTTVTYTYTQNGCSVSEDATVSFLNLPSPVIISSANTYCNNDGVIEISASLTGGTWTRPTAWNTDLIMEEQADGTIDFYLSNVATASTRTLRYSYTDANGCTNTTEKTFTVNFASTVSFANLSATYCENAQNSILLSNQTGGTFTGSGITNNGDGTATFSPLGLAVGNHTITFNYTNTNGCTSQASQTTDVLQSPNLYAITGGVSYCENLAGTTIGLSNSEIGTRYDLVRNSTTITDTKTATSTGAFNFSNLQTSGTYYVLATAANSCRDTMTGTVTVTRDPLPEDANPITGTQNVCVDGTGSYTVDAITNADNYIWELPTNASITSGVNTNSIEVSFPNGTNSGNITVRGENTCGLGELSSLAVSVNQYPPAATTITGAAIVCQAQNSVLYEAAAIATATGYTWTVPNGATIVSGQGTRFIQVNYGANAVSGNVSVFGYNSCGNGTVTNKAITVKTPPLNASVTNLSSPSVINCSGNVISLQANTTTAGVSWAWSTADGIISSNTDIQTISILEAGTYTVTITEPVNSCSTTANITVLENKLTPSVSIAALGANDIVTCQNSTVSIDGTGSSTIGSVSYQWTTSDGTISSSSDIADINVSSGGTYTLEVMDNTNFCTNTQSIQVNENFSTPEIHVSTPNTTQLNCINNSVTLSGGSNDAGATYIWTGPGAIVNGTTTAPIVNTAGTYTLQVTGSNGCIATADVLVEENYSVPAGTSITAPADITCANSMISLQANSTTPGTTYLWSASNGGNILPGNEDKKEPLVNAAGTYTVTVTHPSTGCSTILSTDVATDLTPPDVSFPAIPEQITCDRNTVTISGTTSISNPSYLWSTADGSITSNYTTQNITVSQPGTYTLQITNNDNGCTNVNSISVTQDENVPDLSLNIHGDITCTDPIIALSGTSLTPNVTPLWTTSNGNFTTSSNTGSFSVNVDRAGTYNLSITDNTTGCISTLSTKVNYDTASPVIINFDDSPDVITCYTPTIQLSGNTSTANASLEWTSAQPIQNPTSTTPTVSNAGTYTLELTAANGCTNQRTVAVTENLTEPAIPNIVTPSYLTCSRTKVRLEISPIETNVSYLWSTTGSGSISDNTSATPDVTDLGIYSVTATNLTSGCTSENSVTVNKDITTPDVSIPFEPLPITCSSTSVSISAETTISTASFLWSTNDGGITSGSNSSTVVVNKPGTYTVQITNTANGCKNTTSSEVDIDKEIPDITILPPDTLNCTRTNIQLSGYSLTPNTTGAWITSNGNFTSVANPLNPIVDKAGTYTLTITNTNNGCSNSEDIMVYTDTTKPTITSFSSSPSPITCANTSTELNVSSGTSGVTYNWNGNSTIIDPNTTTPTVSSPGTYNVLLTGPNGCTNSRSVTVTENTTSPDAPVIVTPGQLTCAASEVTLEVDPTDPLVRYSWTTTGLGNITNPNDSRTDINRTGTYIVTAQSLSNGCTSSSSVIVSSDYSEPTTTIESGPYVIDCQNPSIVIDASNSDGINPEWSSVTGGNIISGSRTLTPTVNAAGIYTLTTEHTITGCTSSANINVTTGTDVPDIWVDAYPDKIDCSTNSVTLQGSTTVAQYSWSTSNGNIVSGVNSLTPTVDRAGTYIFTVENTSTGCTATAGVNVESDLAAPVISVNESPEDFSCSVTSVTLSASASSVKDPDPAFSYTWSPGPGGIIYSNGNTPSPTVQSVAEYFVTVQDIDNSCTSVASVTTSIDTVSPTINVDKTPDKLTCSRSTVTLYGTSTTPNTSFSWTTNGSGNIINANTSSPIVDKIGEYILTVTDTVNGCTSTDNVYVEIDTTAPDIWVDNSPNTITCSVTSVQLNGTSADNVDYRWSTNGSGTITNPTTQTPTVNRSGYYVLNITDRLNRCISTDSVLVPEDKIPASVPLVSDTYSCYREANSPLVAIGDNIRWYSDANLNTLIRNNDTLISTENVAGSYTYFATQTGANGCESNGAEASLQIRTLPDRPSITDKSACYNTTVPSLYAAGSNIKWYDTPDGTLLFSGSTFPTGNTNVGVYTYYATQTDGYGCESNAIEASLTIRELPESPTIITPQYAVCYLDNNPEMSVVGTNINWYESSSALNSLESSNYYQSLQFSPGTYYYYVNQTDAFGCISEFDSLQLTIKPLPQKFNIDGGGAYCQGTNGREITLSGSETGTAYRLKYNDALNITIRNGTGTALSFGQQYQEGNYTIEATNDIGCTSQMNGRTAIFIDSLPLQADNITGDPIVCEQERGVLYEVPEIAYATNYNWVLPNGYSIATGANSRIISIDFANNSDNNTIYVYGSNECGDGLPSVDYPIIVNKLPDSANVIIGPETICQNDVISFETDYIPYATSYLWDLPLGTEIVSGENTRQIQIRIGLGDVGGPFMVTGNNTCGDGPSSEILNVTANPVPNVEAGQNIGICSDEYTFEAVVTPPAQGEWLIYNSSATITNINSPTSTVSNLRKGDNIFIWRVTQDGCQNQDTVTITNNEVFVEAGNNQTVCDELTYFTAQTPVQGTGAWSIVSGAATGISVTNPSSPVDGLARGDNVFKWTVTYNGCQSYDTVTITNDQPSNAYAGEDQIVEFPNAELAAGLPQIGSGTWTIEQGAGIFEDENYEMTNVYDLNFGDNILVWTVVNESCISSDRVTITNNSTPYLEAGSNQNICTDTTTLSALNPSPAHGVWTIIRGSATFADNTLHNTRITDIGYGENIFKWTITETGRYDSVIVINNSPTISNAGVDRDLCVDSMILNGNIPVYGTGLWTVVGGGATIDEPTNPLSPVHDLVQGRNELKWTITLDRCVSENTVVIYNNTTSEAEAGLDMQTCNDYAQLGPIQPSFGEGSWRVISGTANIDAEHMATDLGIEQNILEWRISNGECMATDTVIITSHKPTTPMAGVDQFICDNFTTLSGNEILIGEANWEIINGGGTIITPLNSITEITNLTYGRNVFRWSATYEECSLHDDIEINYDFIQANAGEDMTLCNDQASLSANSARTGTGFWSIVGGGSGASFEDQNLENSLVYNLDKGRNILRWTISKNQCTSYDDVVIVNDLPTEPFAGPDRELCTDIYTMQGNAAIVGTGKWEVLSGSAVFADSTSPQSLITNLSLGPNTFRWTMTNGDCQLHDQLTISNNQPINVDAGDDQTVCYDTVSLYASPPSIGEGMWSIINGSARFSDAHSPNTEIFSMAPGENVLLWTVSSALCAARDTVIVINGLPTRPIAGPTQELCSDSTILAANNPLTGTGRWSIVNGTANFSSPTAYNTRVIGLNNGTNTLRWTISTDYCSLYDDVVIENNLPVQAEAGQDFEVCGSTASLYGNSPLIGNGYWSVLSGQATIESPSTGNTQLTNLGFGDNVLRWTIVNGQCISSDDIKVTNNLTPWISAGDDITVLEPSTTLYGSNTTEVAEWKVTAGDASILTPNSFITEVRNLSEGTNTFTWNITINGCTASDQVTVIYKAKPIPKFDIDIQDGCTPLTVEFINQSIGGSPYYWDFGDSTSANTTNAVHEFTKPGKYIVSLTATSRDSISASTDTTIIVHPLPVASFNVKPELVYIPGEEIRCFNKSTGAINYEWEFGDEAESFEESPLHQYTDTGMFSITLIAISEYNCTDTIVVDSAVRAIEQGRLIFPTGFTPNMYGSRGGRYDLEDGTNDIFYPEGEGIETFKMEIYNRWGVLVFSTEDITFGWDGYYNGKLMDQSTYVYYASGLYNNGDDYDMIGSFVLLHNK